MTTLNTPFPLFTDRDGQPLEGGTVYVGMSGTNPVTTPLVVYWDAALTQPTGTLRTMAGYIVRDGTAATVYTSVDYSIAVFDRNGELVFSRLTVSGLGALIQASQVEFTPTLEIPQTNVQDAIVGLQATNTTQITNTIQTYGMGVTGSTPLIANIDAVDRATGDWRADAATTGSFPSGLTAANGSTVETKRGVATNAIEVMHGVAVARSYIVRILASVKQAYREIITVQIAATRGAIARMGASNWEWVALGTNNQVLTSNGTDAVWATPASPVPGGATLLGTIATTSGTSVSLGSLSLTNYKFLRLVFNNVSMNTGTTTILTINGDQISPVNANSAFSWKGMADIDLTNSRFASNLASTSGSGGVGQVWAGNSGLTTASTSITIAASVNSFASGSILVYGVI